MTAHRVAVLALVVLTSTLCAQEKINDLVRDLAGDTPTQLTGEKLAAAYAKAIDLALPDLASDDANKAASAQSAIERIAFVASRPNADPEREALSRAITAKLAAAPPAARPWLIRQLQRIGHSEAVPTLSKLLTDADTNVREAARRALAQNPSPEAVFALNRLLTQEPRIEGAWRVAIVDALASRRDAHVGLLEQEALSKDEAVALAALRGLRNLGNPNVGPKIYELADKGSPGIRTAAMEALLAMAENDGRPAFAMPIYRKLLTSPGHLKCAGIIGIGRVGTAGDLPVIFENAGDADARLRGACVEAIALMKGPEVAAAVVAKIATASPEAKPTLLEGLARRADKSALPVFIAACEDPAEPVKFQAIRGIGVLGDGSCVPLLLKFAAGAGITQDAARWSLAMLRAADVDQAILAATSHADPKVRSEAIRASVARHIEAAAPALLKAAQDAASPTRGESIKAIGSLGQTSDLPAVATLVLKAEDDAVRNEAASAMASIAGREADPALRCQAILQALGNAPAPAKIAIIRILPRVGGQQSLDAVRAAAKDNDEAIKDAGIRALAEWQEFAAADDLLAIAASTSSQAHHVLALRGCIRLAREVRDRPSAERARVLTAALQAAKRPDEKKQAISAMGDVRTADSLQAVMACVGDPALAQEAAQAAARIGREVANDKPELVKQSMQKVMEVTKNEDVRRQAQEAIDRAEQKLKKPK